MRSSKPAITLKQDKILLGMFEANLTQISRLNSAHQLDFSTAKQLVTKLSDKTLKRKYLDELTELRDQREDTHSTHNYMVSMKQIIAKARITIDDLIDLNELNQMTAGLLQPDSESLQAGAYQVQTHPAQQDRGGPRTFNKPPHAKFQGMKRNFHQEPKNIDERGNFI